MQPDLFPSGASEIDPVALESMRALDELFQLAGQFSTRTTYRDLLRFIVRSRMYSPFNAMLIHTQMPGAKYVATPKRWYQDYGRTIRAGARPIMILQPKGPVLFVFDVSDTNPLPGARELPQSVLNPFAIFEGHENGELDQTIENAKRDGVRVQEGSFGSQCAGQIGLSTSPDMMAVTERHLFQKRRVLVPVRYELLLNSRQSREERYAICERKKRAAEALSYNALVQSWPEITRLSADSARQVAQPQQGEFFS